MTAEGDGRPTSGRKPTPKGGQELMLGVRFDYEYHFGPSPLIVAKR
ncbi:MAG: hypothetical protein OEW93_09795 [Candidatus Bathyarchaeota archaeon]|nr:hypothetical protein [Candidatus Bathyarchaeota archaeon]